jgi:hypothetical protein
MITVSSAAGIIMVFKNKGDLESHIKNLQVLADFKATEGQEYPAVYSQFVRPDSGQDVVGWIRHMQDRLLDGIYSGEMPKVHPAGPGSDQAGEI